MTDRNQNGVDWEDDEFLFAVEGLNDDESEGTEAQDSANPRASAPRPPEAGLTAFFGSTRPTRSDNQEEDPLAREEESLSGLMGSGDALDADDLMQELSVRPEERLRDHFAEPAHPLAHDEAWEGSVDEQPRSLNDSFQPAESQVGPNAYDSTDGWGFDDDAAQAASTQDDETFAFVDESDSSGQGRIDHGFQGGAARHQFPPAERLQTDPLGEVVNPSGAAASYDDEFAGEDSEVVSWSDGRQERFAQDEHDGESAEDFHASASDGYDEADAAALAHEGADAYGESEDYDADGEQELTHATIEPAARQPRTGAKTRKFFIVGSVVLAAALAVMAVPRFLEWNEDGEAALNPAANARSAKASVVNPTPKQPKQPKPTEAEVTPVPAEGEAGAGTETTPDPVPPPTNEGDTPEVTPTPEQPLLAENDVTPEGAPMEQLPALGNRPAGEIGRVEIGNELALAGEATPSPEYTTAEMETSDAFTPGEDGAIPATAWADMGGALPAGDTLLRQSRVRVQLRNGSEFDGQLRKIDDAMIELKLDQGTVVFSYEDLREIVPLESTGSRLSEYPEGFVEFRSQARIWGRIVADLPTHVTLAFGPAHINIPKRSVKIVQEQAMSTVLLGTGKSS